MKLSLSLLATAVLALGALPAHAQSVAKAGHQCDALAEEVTPELECLNPDSGNDIRLYVMEFQDCKGGTITSLDRNVGALISRGENADQIDTTSDGVQVTYAKNRTHMDWLAGDTTLLMPTSAIVKSGASTYKLKISNQLQPDYDGALDGEVNFKGSFVELNASGKQVSSGRLECGVAF